MVPRTRVVSLPARLPIERAFAIVSESGHSRFPVHGDDPDEVIGLLRAKDLFRVLGPVVAIGAAEQGQAAPGPTDITVGDLARSPVKVVYESQPLSVVLQEMRQGRHHLAIVVNEFGAFIGIVTLEDVVEEIVGEIRDEHDAEEAPIVELGDGRLVADATVLLSDLSAYLGTSLDQEDAMADSLGGMITEQLGRVPTTGTSLVAQGMRFVVREADEKRVLRVEIVRPVRPSLFPAGTRGSEPPLTGAGARASNPAPDPATPDLAPLVDEIEAAVRRSKQPEG
jgi:CBS domain containing-hemolysin-like protein